jgi:hypothetical protein
MVKKRVRSASGRKTTLVCTLRCVLLPLSFFAPFLVSLTVLCYRRYSLESGNLSCSRLGGVPDSPEADWRIGSSFLPHLFDLVLSDKLTPGPSPLFLHRRPFFSSYFSAFSAA